MSNPNDWLHIYERNHNLTGDNQQQQQPIHQQSMFGGHHSASSIPGAPLVTTNSSSNFFSNSTDQMGSNNDDNTYNNSVSNSSSSSSAHLNPERRVSKPIRRRRASRGAPVTLLNTDPSNFRAMVQQFTGVPNPGFSLAGNIHIPIPHTGTNLNFNLPQRRDGWFQQQDPSSSSAVMLMHQQQQAQQQQFMFANNNNSTVTGTSREGYNHQDQQLLNNPLLPDIE